MGHPNGIIVIWAGFTVIIAMSFVAKWRLDRLAPGIADEAIIPCIAGLLGTWMMAYGCTSVALLPQLSFSIGAMAMCVGFVISLQLCMYHRDIDPPNDDDGVSEPVEPPTDSETKPHLPHYRRTWGTPSVRSDHVNGNHHFARAKFFL